MKVLINNTIKTNDDIINDINSLKQFKKNNEKVSFILPTRDNLEYLKSAYNSIRKNNWIEHEICIADDKSKDNTWEWLLEQQKNDKNLKIWRNETDNRYGLTILYDFLINEISTNELVIACHADMYYGYNFVENLLKHHKDKTVVCATRIEPNIHPPGPEKLIRDYGLYPNSFTENLFLNDCIQLQKQYKNKTTNGFFAPWLISKKDFLLVGGHDPLFRPQSREDSDLGNRLVINEMNLIQSRDSFVYHYTCRGSRFKDGIGKNSDEWQQSNYKNERNFIRKWGSMVAVDNNLMPLVKNKYKIRFVLDCRDEIDSVTFSELLRISEPYFEEIVIYDPDKIYRNTVDNYIKNENKITDFDIKKKFKYNPKELVKMDIELSTQPEIVSKDNGRLIQMIHQVLDQITEIGKYDYNGNKIIVNRINRKYYLIHAKNNISYKLYMKEI